jgi:hypothetical protein
VKWRSATCSQVSNTKERISYFRISLRHWQRRKSTSGVVSKVGEGVTLPCYGCKLGALRASAAIAIFDTPKWEVGWGGGGVPLHLAVLPLDGEYRPFFFNVRRLGIGCSVSPWQTGIRAGAKGKKHLHVRHGLQPDSDTLAFTQFCAFPLCLRLQAHLPAQQSNFLQPQDTNSFFVIF